MTTTLYLIRHGETEWNRLDRIQGHSDIPLTKQGEEEAKQLAKHLVQHPISAIYSSDLARAVATANPLAEVKGLTLQTISDLRERSFGKLEGMASTEVRKLIQESGESAHDVEPYETVQLRAYNSLTNLADRHRNETICAISHGGFIVAFLRQIMDAEQASALTRIANTGVCQLRYDEAGWGIISINDIGHLRHSSLVDKK